MNDHESILFPSVFQYKDYFAYNKQKSVPVPVRKPMWFGIYRFILLHIFYAKNYQYRRSNITFVAIVCNGSFNSFRHPPPPGRVEIPGGGGGFFRKSPHPRGRKFSEFPCPGEILWLKLGHFLAFFRIYVY